MEPQSLAVFGKSSGGEPKKSWDDRAWTMVMNNNDSEQGSSPPSINLGLGIGATAVSVSVSAIGSTGTSGSTSSGQTHVNIKREKLMLMPMPPPPPPPPPVSLLLLTPSQLNELRQQSLIYNYLLAGLPVPLHLLLPIWKSVVASTNSFGSSNGACIYKQFPSFIGFSSQGFDYRTMMEPEPGRCRRTDGKKWRCKRDVVPNNKYCERHVNRGRQRSRKHVEAPEIAAPILPTLPVNTNNSEKSNIYQPVSVPTSLQLSTPTYDNNRTSNATPSTISANSNNERRNITFGHRKDSPATYTITTTSTIPTPSTTIASSTAAAANNITSSRNNVHKEGTRVNHIKRYSNVGKSRKNLDIGSSFPPVLGFSPKSVIEVQDCSSSWVDERNYMNPEPRRCRRTDGKKWQCKNDVVPKSKYCMRHMHRGAKRHCASSQHVAAAAVEVDDSAKMNTNLSIAIPANSPTVINDERSTTTSSSETISADCFTNECSSASHTSALSPS